MRYKKVIVVSSIIIILFIAIFSLLLYFQYRAYTNGFNEKISAILEKVTREYPEIEKSALIKILNENTGNSYELFKEYGIDLEKESAVLVNDTKFNEFVILDTLLILVFSIILLIVFFVYNYKKDKKIKDITKYIEEINKKNYKLDIEDNTEDELSILKNELYKTTVMLKEGQENSLNDKLMLKDSLSDISHQLKTPLTSIIIMLDNILDNKTMDESIRNDFIKDIKREIVNISFLVGAILKLSKFDSNSVKFIQKEVLVNDVISEALKNVEIIRELKNVKIEVIGNNIDTLVCDFKWQVEAITNILKNCIEHSNENGKIDINYEKNNMYLKIEIKDYGSGIDKTDLPHIFERFYKGKDSSNESVRNRTCSI
ncbi:MAG: HAMP domain-containing histidine kinase [Clostridia bacterium]|nr:HAMP domain-containing histidine kinase [Clostridia bacterium]